MEGRFWDLDGDRTTFTPTTNNVSMQLHSHRDIMRRLSNIHSTSVEPSALMWPVRDKQEPYTNQGSKLKVLLEATFAILGIVLNILLLTVICGIRALRVARPTPFILSLALADLVVVAAVMLLSILLGLKDMRWFTERHTELMCAMYSSMLVVACTVSSLNVMAIAIDRYLSITKPLHYVMMSLTGLQMCVVVTWVAGFLLAMPIMLTYPEGSTVREFGSYSSPGHPWFTDTRRPLPADDLILVISDVCNALPPRAYTLVIVIGVIFIPCTVITVIHVKIFVIILRQQAGSKLSLGHFLAAHFPVKDASLSRRAADDQQSRVHGGHSLDRGGIRSESSTDDFYLPPGQDSGAKSDIDSIRFSALLRIQTYDEVRSLGKLTVPDHPSSEPGARNVSWKPGENLFFGPERSTKSMGVLSLICGTFIVCWAPFGIVTLISLFNSNAVDDSLRESLLWLAYSNSCWNPIIYSVLNPFFRNAVSEYFFITEQQLTPIHSQPEPTEHLNVDDILGRQRESRAVSQNTASSFMTLVPGAQQFECDSETKVSSDFTPSSWL